MLGKGFLVRFSNVAQLLTLKCQSRTQQFFRKAVLHVETRFTNLELLKCVEVTFQIKAVAKSQIRRPLEVHRAVSVKQQKMHNNFYSSELESF